MSSHCATLCARAAKGVDPCVEELYFSFHLVGRSRGLGYVANQLDVFGAHVRVAAYVGATIRARTIRPKPLVNALLVKSVHADR